MNDSEKWDRALTQALSAEEPEEALNHSILQRYKEGNPLKRVSRRRKKISAGLLVALCTLVMSITAFAAAQLFTSKQVAEHLGEKALAQAFASSEAIEINQSVASGDYRITLHGIVSGAGLRDWDGGAHDIHPEKTYAVVSIARQDGSFMPLTSDPEYGKEPFFVSPLIRGQKPWQVNIMTMHGGYSEMVVDGIMYRLIECDGMEMFADRGVYLAVSSGGSFFDREAFAYDEHTGDITLRPDYKGGVALLFDLPLDMTKADHAKAEAYLQQLLKEPSTEKNAALAASAEDPEQQLRNEMEELRNKISSGTVIPDSVKEVTKVGQGRFEYAYNDWKVNLTISELFSEGQTGFSDAVHFSGNGRRYWALQFSRDTEGVITGRIVELPAE
ncbi:hypothetical protein WMW72_02075 [Paenibacillus filicis]|uniref:DUF4179 domain-containing protein n=1 Tax=Paenibacillus filicis TaxID=669464 RepID=A0ABU9DD47_9BACL